MSAESSEDVARPGEHRVRSQEVGSHLESADIPAAALFVMIELLEPAAWRRGAMPRVRSPSDSRGLVLRIAAHVWFGAMPRYRASLSSVEKRVPRGAVLPDTLTAFAAALRGIEAGRVGHFSIGPARVDGLVDLDDAALARIVPFASLSRQECSLAEVAHRSERCARGGERPERASRCIDSR